MSVLQVAMQSEGYNLKSWCWTYQQRSLKEKKELVARLKCPLYTPFVNNNNNNNNNNDDDDDDNNKNKIN